jgi:hypothetical protein
MAGQIMPDGLSMRASARRSSSWTLSKRNHSDKRSTHLDRALFMPLWSQ